MKQYYNSSAAADFFTNTKILVSDGIITLIYFIPLSTCIISSFLPLLATLDRL